MFNIYRKDDKSWDVKYSKDIFENQVLLNFISEYSAELFVEVKDNVINIRKNDESEISEKCIKKYLNNLIDFQTRRNLIKENGHIRDLIVEQAFSPARR